MSKQFAYPLAIKGTEEQMRALIPKLEALGYKEASGNCRKQSHEHLTTHFGQKNGEWGWTIDSPAYLYRTEVSVDNKELVLALAAMTTGDVPHVGEIWCMVRAGGWSYHSDNNGCLAIVTEVGSRTVFSEVTTSISGKLINPKTNTYTEFSGVPTRSRGEIVARKATKEEIFAHFTPKNTVTVTNCAAEPEFVLPTHWVLDTEGRDMNMILDWLNKNSTNDCTSYSLILRYLHYPDYSGSHHYTYKQRGYTEITFEQFKKYVLKQDMKKVISYKLKRDLPTVSAGAKIVNTGSDVWTVENTEYEFDTEELDSLKDWFEPVYEQEFKVGDWVVFQPEKAVGTYCHTNYWNKPYILQIKSIRGIILGFGDADNRSEFFRLATAEEIEEVTAIEFKGYRAVVEGDQITFGCQKFSRQNLDVIWKLLGKEIGAIITIDGKPVTTDLLEKLAKKLK